MDGSRAGGSEGRRETPVIDIIKYRKPVTELAVADRLIIQVGREVFRERHVHLATFEEARREFGEKNLVDLVSVMAEYAGTAVLLNAFDQQLRVGQAHCSPALRC